MKINDILVLETEQLDEYGNAPNDSTDPKTAGGVPNAVGNMKAQRKARAGLNKQLQDPATPQQPAPQAGATQPPAAGQTPAATTPATTTPTVDTTARTDGNAGTTGQTVTTRTKGNPALAGWAAAAGSQLNMPDADRAVRALSPRDQTVTTPGTDTTGQTGAPDTTGQTGGQTDGATPTPTPAADSQTGQPNPAAQGQEPGQQADANKDPQYKIFKDPAAFKSEWDKYVATKSQPYQLIADPEMLTALKDMWMRSGGTRVESRRPSKKAQRLIEQRIMKDPIYESFSRVGRMIAEANLTQQQIQQLFKAVADGAAAGGNVQNAGDNPVSNRTWVGRGGDAASWLAKGWDTVKTKISQSAPVAGFDQLVDTAQGKLLKAAGGQAGPVGQALQKYKEFGQQHPILQGAIYAGIIALMGISGAGLGGAALLGGIKTFDRLLQGDKASSALWRGFKTGAIAWGAGQLGQHLQNQSPGTTNPTVDPTNPDAWADGTQANGTDTIPYTVQQGETLSQIAKSNGVSVKDMMDANPDITNPDVLKTGQALQIPQSTGEYNVYDQGVGTQADTLSKIKSGEYTDSPISHRDLSGGATTNAGAGQVNQLTPKSSFDAGGVNPQDQAMLANNPAIQAANSKIDAADAANYQQQLDAYNQEAREYMQQQIQDGANADKALTKWATSQGIDKSDLVAGIAKDENGDFYPGWSQPEGSDWYVYNPTNDPDMTYPDNFRLNAKSITNSSYVSPRAMISEYVDYNATMRSRMLAEMRGMPQNGCYLTSAGVKAIFEGVVAEGPWDTIKNVGSKIAGGVEKFGQGVADTVKKGYDAAANKITLDKLDLNWRKNYKEFDPTGGKGPVDSEKVKEFLRKQGVTDVLINKVFGDLGLEQPMANPTQAQSSFTSGAAFTDLFKKFSDSGGNLAPQVRGVLKDILLTAMRTVESMQRQRMYGAPVLSEVRTDFSAALLKSLR